MRSGCFKKLVEDVIVALGSVIKELADDRACDIVSFQCDSQSCVLLSRRQLPRLFVRRMWLYVVDWMTVVWHSRFASYLGTTE